MNGNTLPTVAISATSNATREVPTAAPLGHVDRTPNESAGSTENSPTTLTVEPRKKRMFIDPGRVIAQSDGNDDLPPGERREKNQSRSPWIIHKMLAYGGVLALLADQVSTANKTNALFSEVCAMRASTPEFRADQVVPQLLVSTLRENAADLSVQASRPALPMVFKKCYVARNGVPMPLSTYGLAERIHGDLDLLLARVDSEEDKYQRRLFMVQVTCLEFDREMDGVANFIRDLTTIDQTPR